ncbi:glycoside hydrolase family 5 protein [Aquihabitans sp. McL0605]|uniref:glycoside hydrolase family 5 protein n=1 Tax=Aquihabitans sp. McL0605 TaxID=3415671 RepID=UPI003CF117AF
MTSPVRPFSAGVLAAALLVSLAVVAPTGGSGASPARVSAPRADAADVVELLPLSTSSDHRIVDSKGRDVLLRGANVNSLGEYWQGVPSIDPTLPVTDADWEEMAAHGFSVVRLLISWSKVEPTRGTFDQAYLDTVDEHVQAAKAHGIYTVIDMHQDAYTAALSTTDPATCPAGTTPAKGWDGAPAWAVLSDGLSTCLTGSDRNSSPAVNRAWNNFYDNVDGIRDEFVKAWKAVAAHFAGRPEVAGYDVLNEPENPRAAADLQAVYEDFLADSIAGIRDAEAGAPFEHLILIEPALPAGDPTRGLVIPNPKAAGVDTKDIVASVHNYSESIDNGLGLTIEGLNDLIDQLTAGMGVPDWGGEYGFWDTSASTLAKVERYAADEDAHAWGGAWWQWRQSCGDPHAVQWSGGSVVAPTDVSTHLNKLQCPGNTDLGPTDEFLDAVGRGYPRATPGRITELRSDIATGLMKVKATATEKGGQLVVWTPTAHDAAHPINTFGLTDVVEHDVAGGRIITATVSVTGVYALWVGPVDEDLSKPAEEPAAPGEPAAAVPVAGDPSFTG